MWCRRPPHGPQQENSGVVVLSLSWHNSPAAHGMVCRQVLAAARNTQRVVCSSVCGSVQQQEGLREHEKMNHPGIPAYHR